MARQNVYARVNMPVELPGGPMLHAGQSIEPAEMAALGEETLARMSDGGAIELRRRHESGARGILTYSALAESAERCRGELAAFCRALEAARTGMAQNGPPPGGTDRPLPAEAEEGAPSEELHRLAPTLPPRRTQEEGAGE